MDKLEEAINAIKLILEESNPNDKKTRINPKVTAMLHCNLAELLIWQGKFDRADASVNLAINSGEGKAKRHCKGELLFYKGQRNRWNVHF
jgi:predicted negative regulator of RcsB-dependent stress response